MNILLKIFSVCLVVIVVNCWWVYRTSSVPRLDHVWWGPVYSKFQNDTSIRPFQVHFDEEMILDLRYRLKNHRPFTPPLEGVAFDYGFNTDHLHSWVDYWADQYPFKLQENIFNQYPQFKTNIQGLDIHFLWVKPHSDSHLTGDEDTYHLYSRDPARTPYHWDDSTSAGFSTSENTWLPVAKDYKEINLAKQKSDEKSHFKVPLTVEVVPLLLLHGWPSSVREFFGTLPHITAAPMCRDFAVEVIAPSLPGFGFSDPAVRPGLGATEMAVVLRNLMHRLGYKRFYVQGGDWGAYIGLSMATLYPKEVLGFHTNLPMSISPSSVAIWVLGSVYPALVVEPYLASRMYPILSIIYWMTRETGYLHLQATKPDTVGVAISDSPSGLLAYIYQLFSSGSRRKFYHRSDGGFDELYTRDELIDNLMIYWITYSFTTSSRIYAETLNLRNINMGVFAIPTPVPTWTIHARDEIFYQSPTLLRIKFPNLLNSTVLDTGGHFLALEKPEVFADDVLNAITAFRRLYRQNKKSKN